MDGVDYFVVSLKASVWLPRFAVGLLNAYALGGELGAIGRWEGRWSRKPRRDGTGWLVGELDTRE